MNALRQYRDLTAMQLLSMRGEMWFIAILHIALSLGLVLGFGYLIPDITDSTALFMITGTATQAIVTVGLVMLPQMLAQSKEEGRMEYFLTMPISREAYLASLVTVVGAMALPGVAFSVLFGAWYYDVPLQVDPAVILVLFLGVASLAGVGVTMAVVSPHQQVTNALTQLIIFFVLFFSPVLMPAEQLPWLLQQTAHLAPPTYTADAVRATLTELPGTHLGRSLLVMTGFAVASLTMSSAAIRRRG